MCNELNINQYMQPLKLESIYYEQNNILNKAPNLSTMYSNLISRIPITEKITLLKKLYDITSNRNLSLYTTNPIYDNQSISNYLNDTPEFKQIIRQTLEYYTYGSIEELPLSLYLTLTTRTGTTYMFKNNTKIIIDALKNKIENRIN